MSLFDGLGSYDSPERRAAIKRQQAAFLADQIAEKQRRQPDRGNERQPSTGAQPGWSPMPNGASTPTAPPRIPQNIPNPSWPWQAGVISPLQAGFIPPLPAWQTPPAAARPKSHFPMLPLQAGWEAPQFQSQSHVASSDQGAHASRASVGQGVGRGVARPLTSARGGWLHPQMRSQVDEVIYGHDMDGYGGAPNAQRPRGTPAPPPFEQHMQQYQQQQPPRSQPRPATSEPSRAQIDIDAEWAQWEQQNPQFRRRRKAAPDGNQVTTHAENVSHAAARPQSGKKANNHVIDIDGEWAEWESKHPEFQRRRKRRDGGPDSAPGTPTPTGEASGTKSPQNGPNHAASPVANPFAVSAARPPLPPPQLRTPTEGPSLTARRPPDSVRSVADSSLQQELRRLRHKCSDQRALLHSQVEELKAQASKLLAEQAQLPSKLAPLNRIPLGAPLRPLPASRPQITSLPLLHLLEERRPFHSAWQTPPHVNQLGGLAERLAVAELKVGSGRTQVTPHLAVAELKLAGVEAELKRENRRVLALQGCPHCGSQSPIGNDQHQEFTGKTLPEASTLVFPDTFPEPWRSPLPNQLMQQAPVSMANQSTNSPAPAPALPAPREEKDSAAAVSDGDEIAPKPSVRSDLLHVPVSHTGATFEFDTLRYSSTLSGGFGTTNLPPQAASSQQVDDVPSAQVPFARVVDLGAALRGLSEEPNGSSESPLRDDVDAASEATAAPAVAESETSAELTGEPAIAGAALPPLAPTSLAKDPPQASHVQNTPSFSSAASPRRNLPRPATDADVRQSRGAQEAENFSAERRTQDFLMDVLIPEAKGSPPDGTIRQAEEATPAAPDSDSALTSTPLAAPEGGESADVSVDAQTGVAAATGSSDVATQPDAAVLLPPPPPVPPEPVD